MGCVKFKTGRRTVSRNSKNLYVIKKISVMISEDPQLNSYNGNGWKTRVGFILLILGSKFKALDPSIIKY